MCKNMPVFLKKKVLILGSVLHILNGKSGRKLNRQDAKNVKGVQREVCLRILKAEGYE